MDENGKTTATGSVLDSRSPTPATATPPPTYEPPPPYPGPPIYGEALPAAAMPPIPECIPLRPGPNAMVHRRGMVTDWLTVTPEVAAWTLLHLNNCNRKMPPGEAPVMSADIRNDDWHEHHQGIAFLGFNVPPHQVGNLCDGQTRLQAIVNTGKPLHLMVTWNLTKPAMQAVDSGKVRSLKDACMIRGITTNDLALAVVRAMEAAGAGKREKRSRAYHINYLLRYGEAIAFVEEHFYKPASGVEGLRHSAVVAAIARSYFELKRDGKLDRLKSFCDILATSGYDKRPVAEGGDGEPGAMVAHLRDFLGRQKNIRQAEKTVMHGKTQVALQAFLEGRGLKRLHEKRVNGKLVELWPHMEAVADEMAEAEAIAAREAAAGAIHTA